MPPGSGDVKFRRPVVRSRGGRSWLGFVVVGALYGVYALVVNAKHTLDVSSQLGVLTEHAASVCSIDDAD